MDFCLAGKKEPIQCGWWVYVWVCVLSTHRERRNYQHIATVEAHIPAFAFQNRTHLRWGFVCEVTAEHRHAAPGVRVATGRGGQINGNVLGSLVETYV